MNILRPTETVRKDTVVQGTSTAIAPPSCQQPSPGGVQPRTDGYQVVPAQRVNTRALPLVPDGEYVLPVDVGTQQPIPLKFIRHGESMTMEVAGARGTGGHSAVDAEGRFAITYPHSRRSGSVHVEGTVTFDPFEKHFHLEFTQRVTLKYETREIAFFNDRGAAEYRVVQKVASASEVKHSAVVGLDGNLRSASRPLADYSVAGGQHTGQASILMVDQQLFLKVACKEMDFVAPIGPAGRVECVLDSHCGGDMLRVQGQVETGLIRLDVEKVWFLAGGESVTLSGSRVDDENMAS